MKSELTCTVDHTAKLLGLSPQTIRLWLQSESCPFGYAVHLRGSSRTKYVISRARVTEFLENKKDADSESAPNKQVITN